MRLAHGMADTIVTPLNDSFMDFDVLGTIDPVTYSVTGEGYYEEMVRDTAPAPAVIVTLCWPAYVRADFPIIRD